MSELSTGELDSLEAMEKAATPGRWSQNGKWKSELNGPSGSLGEFYFATENCALLEEGLKPFADFAVAFDESHVKATGRDPKKYRLGDEETFSTCGIYGTATYRQLCAKDLRRAARLLQPKEPQK